MIHTRTLGEGTAAVPSPETIKYSCLLGEASPRLNVASSGVYNVRLSVELVVQNRQGSSLKLIRFGDLLLASPTPKWVTLATLVGLLLASEAYAQVPNDSKRMSLLPAFCKHTLVYRGKVPGGNDPAEIERWTKIMGGRHNFMHLHHYCWALEHTNQALFFERTKLERDRRLRASLADFDYVIGNVSPDFALLPEILTKKGQNLIRLGRTPEAVRELNRAINVNPIYWPPYAALSDHYNDTGDSARAREWLEKGLKAAPDASALKRRLAELNTTKSRPKKANQQ